MDGWATLALVMDCRTRKLLGWHLSRSGKASTTASALAHALIARFGSLGRVEAPFLRRSDNGLVFTSRKYSALVRSYGLRQEFITPHCPRQNGMMERLIRSPKEQCVHRQHFESLAQSAAQSVTGSSSTTDLPPGGPSFITRACGLDFGIRHLQIWQARRARRPQISQALGALPPGSCFQAMSAA